MRYLFVAVGSHGDVHPLLGLAVRMRERGHEVALAANEHFGPLVRSTGVEHLKLGEEAEFLDGLKNPDLWHPRRGAKAVFLQGVLPGVRPTYDVVAEQLQRGPTVVVAHAIAFGARMARDKFRFPLITTQLQPSVFRTMYDAPILPGFPLRPWMPKWMKRSLWIMADVVIDGLLCKPLNAMRAEVGLRPVRGILRDWWMSPDCVLALFPNWFGPRQPDWPPQTIMTGFPLWDERGLHSLPSEKVEGGDEGFPRDSHASTATHSPRETPHPASPLSVERSRMPIAFTPGSAMTHGADFFRESAEVCRRMNRPGILLTRHGEQIPKTLPPGVVHLPYAPFSELLPNVAALVHHGGIGTTAQCLAAGCPQLIMPLAHDQFDNALRIERLGVGTSIARSQYRASIVQRKLSTILNNPAVQQACASVASRFGNVDPIADACDAIERLAIPSAEHPVSVA